MAAARADTLSADGKSRPSDGQSQRRSDRPDALTAEQFQDLIDRGLDALTDEEFHDVVDRELRKDHLWTPEHERPYLQALSQKLRHPSVIDRWIMELSVMKGSAETQLGAKRADLKKIHGTVSEGEYAAKLRTFDAWKAGNLRFLHSVELRLRQARYERMRLHRDDSAARAALDLAVQAIRTHRSTVLSEDYEPTPADNNLWAVIPEEDEVASP